MTSEYSNKLAHDNKMSQEFFNQINSIDNQEESVQKIGTVRKQYYTSLAYANEGKPNKNHKFLDGWLKRVDRCLNYKESTSWDASFLRSLSPDMLPLNRLPAIGIGITLRVREHSQSS
jgi:hypothetical protein